MASVFNALARIVRFPYPIVYPRYYVTAHAGRVNTNKWGPEPPFVGKQTDVLAKNRYNSYSDFFSHHLLVFLLIFSQKYCYRIRHHQPMIFYGF